MGVTAMKKETPEEKKKRAGAILRWLKRAYPNATTALNYSNPLELLVATVLSAQCTDAKVNQVTATLFKKYRSAQDYASVPQEVLEQEIRSTGFFRNKAKSIRGLAQRIAAEHNGEVPADMEALTALPGVARKTANLVLGTAFGIPSGVVVDTHVERLSRRMGLSAEKTPEKIERELMALFPKKEWVVLGHSLILHGRAICSARKPLCEQCPVEDLCPKVL